MTSISALVKSSFVPGDQIKTACFGGWLFHHAIFDGWIDENQGWAIHFQGSNATASEDDEDTGIAQSTKYNIQRTMIRLSDFTVVFRPNNPMKVLGRARSKQHSNETYDVLFNNCESFVNWCLTGSLVSGQSMMVTRTVVAAGAAFKGVSVLGHVSDLVIILSEIGPPIGRAVQALFSGRSGESVANDIVKAATSSKTVMAMAGIIGGVAGGAAAAYAAAALVSAPLAVPLAAFGGCVLGGSALSELVRRLYARLYGKFCQDKNMTLREAYRVLEFGEQDTHITIKEINTRYKKLAKKYHTDRDGGNLDKFIELSTAIEILRAAFRGIEERERALDHRRSAEKEWAKQASAQLNCVQTLIQKEKLLVEAQESVMAEEKQGTTLHKLLQQEKTSLKKKLEDVIAAEHNLAASEKLHLKAKSKLRLLESRRTACSEYCNFLNECRVKAQDLSAEASRIKFKAQAKLERRFIFKFRIRRKISVAEEALDKAEKALRECEIKILDAHYDMESISTDMDILSMQIAKHKLTIKNAEEHVKEKQNALLTHTASTKESEKKLLSAKTNLDEAKFEFESALKEKAEAEKKLNEIEMNIQQAEESVKEADKEYNEVKRDWGEGPLQFANINVSREIFRRFQSHERKKIEAKAKIVKEKERERDPNELTCLEWARNKEERKHASIQQVTFKLQNDLEDQRFRDESEMSALTESLAAAARSEMMQKAKQTSTEKQDLRTLLSAAKIQK